MSCGPEPTAWLFPGQGSQHVGMGRAAFERYPEVRSAFEEADTALGMPLSRICFDGDEEALRQTANTQPAILTVSVALARVLQAHGCEPQWMAGHSLGEYSALVVAGSLDLASAVRLVRDRGRYMQEAVPDGEGAMAAIIGLEDAAIQAACQRASAMGGVVQPANYNSPGQVVIAGDRDAVTRAVALAKDSGARRALMLTVSAPFHCELMAPAAERLAGDLKRVRFLDPRVPIFCNVDAVPLTRGEQIAEALRRQVVSPVRWVADLQAMADAGARRFVEIGPGKVLTGLTRRTIKGSTAISVQGPEDIEALVA